MTALSQQAGQAGQDCGETDSCWVPGNVILAGCQYQYPHHTRPYNNTQSAVSSLQDSNSNTTVTDSCLHPALLSNFEEIHLMASGTVQVRPERAVVVQLVIQLVSVFTKLVTYADDSRLLQILSSCCDSDLIQHRPARPGQARHDWTALITKWILSVVVVLTSHNKVWYNWLDNPTSPSSW